jgi:hypothetical protein
VTVLDKDVPDPMVMAPSGDACGMDAADSLVCADASGRLRTWPVGVRGALSIGPDGSAWLAGWRDSPWSGGAGLVARLPISLDD